MSSQHLCLTCQLAVWNKTSNGRLHPNGLGRCNWKPPYIPTPAKWVWDITKRNKQPIPMWGQVQRKPHTPVTECETYQEAGL